MGPMMSSRKKKNANKLKDPYRTCSFFEIHQFLMWWTLERRLGGMMSLSRIQHGSTRSQLKIMRKNNIVYLLIILIYYHIFFFVGGGDTAVQHVFKIPIFPHAAEIQMEWMLFTPN